MQKGNKFVWKKNGFRKLLNKTKFTIRENFLFHFLFLKNEWKTDNIPNLTYE